MWVNFKASFRRQNKDISRGANQPELLTVILDPIQSLTPTDQQWIYFLEDNSSFAHGDNRDGPERQVVQFLTIYVSHFQSLQRPGLNGG